MQQNAQQSGQQLANLQSICSMLGQALLQTKQQTEENGAKITHLATETAENGTKISAVQEELNKIKANGVKIVERFAAIDTQAALRRAIQFIETVGMDSTRGTVVAWPVAIPQPAAPPLTCIVISYHLLASAYRKLYPNRETIAQDAFHTAFQKLPIIDDLTPDILEVIVGALPIKPYTQRRQNTLWAVLPLQHYVAVCKQRREGPYKSEEFAPPAQDQFPLALPSNGKQSYYDDSDSHTKHAWNYPASKEALSMPAVQEYLHAMGHGDALLEHHDDAVHFCGPTLLPNFPVRLHSNLLSAQDEREERHYKNNAAPEEGEEEEEQEEEEKGEEEAYEEEQEEEEKGEEEAYEEEQEDEDEDEDEDDRRKSRKRKASGSVGAAKGRARRSTRARN
jgi:hypothetical protein